MKNTAVEWLVEKLKNYEVGEILLKLHKEEINQAKEIFEQQIKDAYNQGYRHGELDDNVNDLDISKYSDAQNYYKENYKKQ